MEIGIFGVTANPPHLGHFQAIKEAASKVNELWVSPVFKHPFNKSFIDYDKRLEMLSLLVDNKIDNVFIKELDKAYIEDTNEKTVYSYNLLSSLKNKYNSINFKLVVGEDNYKKDVWEKFYKHFELENEFGLIVVKDRGAHSSDIRAKIKNNESISGLVSKEVESYIVENLLYKEE